MDGADILSLSLLSYAIFLIGNWVELLDHMKRKRIKHFKEYELAMTETHVYHDLPLIAYSYTDDMLFYKFQSFSNITNYKHWNFLV